MTWWEALILGVVQGLTEFFPVSSSGHLVMTEELLGLRLPGVSFDVALHLATLVSVVIVYRSTLRRVIVGAFARRERASWEYLFKIALASIPAAAAGLLFKDWFEARFDDPVFAGTMVLVTGCVVWSSRWARRESGFPLLELVPVVIAAAAALMAGTALPFVVVLAVQATIMAVARLTAAASWHPAPTWWGAFLMGVAQALAILPGISRSGSTVLAALWRRIDAEAAAEFSFLMSIPAILGAGLLSVADIGAGGAPDVGMVPMIVGALGAGVAGVLAIRFFVQMLRRRSFHVFAYYCWLVGTVFILTR